MGDAVQVLLAWEVLPCSVETRRTRFEGAWRAWVGSWKRWFYFELRGHLSVEGRQADVMEDRIADQELRVHVTRVAVRGEKEKSKKRKE